MITYLSLSLTLSGVLALSALALSAFKRVAPALRLALLYSFLLKSLLPWGLIDISSPITLPQLSAFFTKTAAEALPAPSPDLSSNFRSERVNEAKLHHYGSMLEQGLLIAWVAIAASLVVAALIRLALLRRAVGRSLRLGRFTTVAARTDGVPPVRVVVMDRIRSPLLFRRHGWVVLVPQFFSFLSQTDQRVVIAHEMAHIDRLDFVKYLCLGFIRLLFFFSPFVKIIIGLIVDQEEKAADRRAMNSLGLSPGAYGRAIVNFCARASEGRYLIPAFAAYAKSAKRRLRMRLIGLFDRTTPNKVAVIASGALLAVVLLVSPIAAEPGPSVAAPESVKAMTELVLIRPFEGGWISLPFGLNINPFTQKEFFHNGIDIAWKIGTPIKAAASGVVSETGNDERGNYIVIAHGDELASLYWHLDSIAIQAGQAVEAGEQIGCLGNTGLSTGPHLHFELRRAGEAIDPRTVIDF